MAYKEFALDSQTVVKIVKNKRSKSLRISIGHNGEIKVTIPAWTSYQIGLSFAMAKKAWIREHGRKPLLLKPGQSVGKSHHLEFVPDAVLSVKSKIVKTQILVMHPANLSFDNPEVQKVAVLACIRALRSQSQTLLPYRLSSLAEKHEFEFNRVSIKQMKARWGSCDQNKNILLNLFLIQLPWDLIDYVLLHELVHTKVLKHGPDFWAEFSQVLPDAKAKRNSMRGYRPNIFSA